MRKNRRITKRSEDSIAALRDSRTTARDTLEGQECAVVPLRATHRLRVSLQDYFSTPPPKGSLARIEVVPGGMFRAVCRRKDSDSDVLFYVSEPLLKSWFIPLEDAPHED